MVQSGTGRGGVDMEADEIWNAGDMGCGELVLELRARLAGLRPGQVFELIAHDLGAPADIPAWCRLTGHTLLSHEHPVYRIRRKEN
jgi:tRNA 2-thiouridine synthesizing protein A